MNYFITSRTWLLAMLLSAATSGISTQAFEPRSKSLPVACPSGGIQLLGQGSLCEFVDVEGGPLNWILEEDVLTVTPREEMALPNHAISQIHFRDADIHVEFLLPAGWTGNSGIYLHGLYELQVLNSFGVSTMTEYEMGALYKFFKPLVNASKPPLAWQAYDIRYVAPRRKANGRVTKPGVVTAWLNGKLVQDRAQFTAPRSKHCPLQSDATPYLNAMRDSVRATEQGPLVLQEHLSPVCFRNVWIKSLDGRTSPFERSEQPKLIIGLIGDSTVASTYGWGPALADQLIDEARVVNYAENGATLEALSKELDTLLEWSPHYVLVQFGHNDQKRYGTQQYGELLRSYANRIRDAGAEVVIVSPVTRRNFDQQGKIKPKPWNNPDQPFHGALADYAREASEVAKEIETSLIPLHALSIKQHNLIGPVASGAYNYTASDITHFSETGAEAIAGLIVKRLRKVVPELADPGLP